MVSVLFSGVVSAQYVSGETVTITVTKPDNLTEEIVTQTLEDKTYSVTKEYLIAGTYKAKSHGDADAVYTAWASEEKTFLIKPIPRSGTIEVNFA